jgi:hypothetical protein
MGLVSTRRLRGGEIQGFSSVAILGVATMISNGTLRLTELLEEENGRHLIPTAVFLVERSYRPDQLTYTIDTVSRVVISSGGMSPF